MMRVTLSGMLVCVVCELLNKIAGCGQSMRAIYTSTHLASTPT